MFLIRAHVTQLVRFATTGFPTWVSLSSLPAMQTWLNCCSVSNHHITRFTWPVHTGATRSGQPAISGHAKVREASFLLHCSLWPWPLSQVHSFTARGGIRLSRLDLLCSWKRTACFCTPATNGQVLQLVTKLSWSPRCLSQRQHMAREASECRWLLNKQASQECCVISAPAAAPLSRQHSRSRCSLPTLARFNQRFCAGAIKAGRALRPNPFLPPILTWWEVIWPFLPVVLPVNIPRGLGSLDAQLTSTCSLNTSNYPIVVTCRDPISSTNRLTHTHKERKRVCGQRLF